MVGKSRQEFFVGLQRIALDRGHIGVCVRQIADRSGRNVRARSRSSGGRGIGRALEKQECRVETGGEPRELGALRHVADAQTRPLEHLRQCEASLAHHLGERLRVGAIRSVLVRRDRAGGSVERHQRAWARLDQREPARERRAGDGEGVAARGIEYENARLQFECCQGPDVIRNAQRFGCHIRSASDLCIYGEEIVLSFELQPIAAQIDECDRVRSRARGLAQKVTQRAAQRVLIEIARPDHIEAGRLQRLGDQPGVIGAGLERTCLIAGIADDKRDALFLSLRLGRPDKAEQYQRAERNEASE
jgi:hypothetical protein